MSVVSPAVFVGFGANAPELNYDDFGDIDLRGKIAIAFFGAPHNFPVNQRAYYSDILVKAKECVRRGAVSLVIMLLPRDEARIPWAITLAIFRAPRMHLIDADGGLVNGIPELKAMAGLKGTAATQLFTATGHDFSAVIAKADRGEPQRFALGCELALSARAKVSLAESMNVVALLPGSDPSLAGEPMIVTAHLDHIGIGRAVDGDSIYNGAMDNAIGVGVMLAVAEHLAARPAAPRPVLFAALTAEEKGQLGAEHLARHPPKGVRRFAANLNLDMALFSAPVRDLIARGEEHSTLGGVIAKVAATAGFTISPDPIPEEVVFTRSDQYAFVQSGVPAIYLGNGSRSTDPTIDLKAREQDFLKTRYHKRTDGLTQPIDWESVAAFAGGCISPTRDAKMGEDVAHQNL